MQALDTALLLLAAGYRIVPVRGKRPPGKGWLRDWSEGEIEQALTSGRADGIGLIMDGLIDFDEDGPTAGETFDELGLPPTVSWSSAKGRHHIYKIPAALREELTATGRRKIKMGDLEVRWTDGVQSVLPPSGGREWIRSLLDQDPAPLPHTDWLIEELPRTDRRQGVEGSEGPGHLFNQQAEWAEILEPHGYKLVGERSEGGHLVQDWLRPGDTEQKLSLTTGYCRSTADEDKLYCFSTSCEPLPPNVALSKFAVHALLEHEGDYTAAARHLARNGYAPEIKVADFPDDLPEPTAADLMEIPVMPGLVEDLAEWHCRRAQVADMQSGRVVGIMALSWLLGRRAKLGMDGTRANLLALLSGRPGSGKSEILRSLADLVTGTGAKGELLSEAASGQAIEDMLAECPRILYLKDEATDLIHDARENIHSHSVLARLREYYSKSRSVHVPRRKASQKATSEPIIQPYLTTLLVGPGSSLWDALPEVFYRDGFVARVLPFALRDDAPEVERPCEEPPPASFLTAEADWTAKAQFDEAPAEVEGEKRVAELPPTLLDIPCTPAAEKFLRQLKRDWRAYRGDDQTTEFYMRGQELTCKLSMIAAASAGCEVDEHIAQTMASFVERVINYKLQAWESRYIGDRNYQELYDRVLSMVTNNDKGKGVYLSRLRGKLNGIDPDRLNRVLFGLFLAGKIKASGVSSRTSFESVTKVFSRKGVAEVGE